MPAELASAVATVGSTAPFAVNQVLYAAKTDGSVRGYLQVTAIGGATSITLKNLEDAATSAYADNSAPGSVFTIGSQLQSGGAQGPAGIAGSSAMGGHVTGTIAANELTLNAALGALPVGNGSEAAALTKGTDGQILVSDAAAALDLTWKSIVPITGDTDVLIDRVVRLSATTGLPIPLESSRMAVRDAGGAGTLVVDDRSSVANARGTDATDLQTSRTAVTQVAAGNESGILSGRRHTNNGNRAVIAGGDTNIINTGAQEGVISGGTNNVIAATGIQAVVAGGDSNSAAGEESVIGGGDTNSTSAAATNAVIGGGVSNSATAVRATIAGGSGGTASQTGATIGGGQTNTASGVDTTVAGGLLNTASGEKSSVTGGYGAVADKYGQRAFAAGYRSAAGDAQCTDLVWRTTASGGAGAPNATMFLDGFGGAARATIAANRLWAFDILVTGRTAAFVCAAWRIVGAIQNIAGTTTLVAAVTTTVIADGTGATWGVAGNVVVEADNVNDTLNIRVGATVDPGATTHWTAHGRIIENA